MITALWHALTQMYTHTAGVKIQNMPVSVHCTLTLKLGITQRIIPVYVCVSVSLPAGLSVYPFIPSPNSLSLQLHLMSTSLAWNKHRHWHNCSLMPFCFWFELNKWKFTSWVILKWPILCHYFSHYIITVKSHVLNSTLQQVLVLSPLPLFMDVICPCK